MKARKLAEREEAQHQKAARLAKQAAVRAAKAVEKARRATEREQNQHQQALQIMERAEGRQTSVSREVGIGVVYNGGFENPYVSSHSQSKVAPVDVPQVCHSTFHSMPVPVDMHG